MYNPITDLSDPKDLAIVHINNYVWDIVSGSVTNPGILAASAVWNPNNYNYKPFYPVSENLAPDSANLPYVLYDYMFIEKTGTFWPIQREEASYVIVGDVPNIMYVKNLIIDLLEKFDESATNVNNYLLASNSSSNVRFKYITAEQDNFIADEKRIESFAPKYITCIKLTYEYTK